MDFDFIAKYFIFLLVSLGIMFVLSLIFLPRYLVKRKDSLYEKKIFPENRFELLRAENDIRRLIAQIAGGIFLLLTILISFNAYNETKDKNITDRFSQAVQLISSNNENTRIAGLYSMERIMVDSEKDYFRIIQILCSYIRTYSPKYPNDSLSFGYKKIPQVNGQDTTVSFIANQDIQIAFNILGFIPNKKFTHTLDLRNTDIRGLEMYNLNLMNIYFVNSNLQNVKILYSSLDSAYFENVSLKNVVFQNTVLNNSTFLKSEFRDTFFEYYNSDHKINEDIYIDTLNMNYVKFSECLFNGANFNGVNLSNSLFKLINISNSNSRASNFINVNLSKSKFVEVNFLNIYFKQTNIRGANFVNSLNIQPSVLCWEILDSTTILTEINILGERIVPLQNFRNSR